MLKTILAILILIIPTVSNAESINIIDGLKKIPALKQGVAYNIPDAKFSYISTIGILKYNDFGLSAGYSSDDKIIATVDYDIGGFKKLGIDTPITNLIDLSVGFYAGYGRITGSNEFSYGPSLTIININF